MGVDRVDGGSTPLLLPPVAGGTLTERVQQVMRDRIVSGVWPAGMKLPPIERLAEEVGVSRTVAREAVKALASQGLLRVVHGQGTSVAPGTNRPVVEALRYRLRGSADLLGIMGVRLALEVEAAALAAERRTEEDVEVLRQALDRLLVVDQLPAAPRATKFVEVDVAFHEAVVRATHNPVLAMVTESMAELFHETRRAIAAARAGSGGASGASVSPVSPVNQPQQTPRKGDSHVAIFRRILARDGPGAAAAMRSHLSEVRDNLAALAKAQE